jgi:hypothetical protein
MNKYQNGKIYKLVNTEGTLTYIGSTCQTLAKRKSNHHESYKLWKNGKSRYITSFKIFDDDEDGCQIILLEALPCNSKTELEKRERFYIESHECVNKTRPTRTKNEYYNDNKDKIKQYALNNKDKIQEFQKQYREFNKEKILHQAKKYYEDNKNKIQEYKTQYREDNKEKFQGRGKNYYEGNKIKFKHYYENNKQKIANRLNIKNICGCGGKYTEGNKLVHSKTKRHINYLNCIKNENEEFVRF